MKTDQRIHVVSVRPLNDEQKARLRRRGELVYYDAVLQDPDLIDRCRGADILVITPRIHLDIVPRLEHCRLIAVQATGTDAFNLEAATEKGIVVSNVPDFGPDAVAEHAFALLLGACRRLSLGQKMLRSGTWRTGIAYEGKGLKGKTLGIFGFGKIGREIARIGNGFATEVIVTTRHPDKKREEEHQVKFVDFDRLLVESDHLIVAAPLTAETEGAFGKQAFERMKSSAVFVNIARGALVDEAALVAALESGQIAAAGIDVYCEEPPPPDHPLLHLENAVVTPHIAAGTEEAVQRLLDGAIDNVEAFLDGRPTNVVNPAVLSR